MVVWPGFGRKRSGDARSLPAEAVEVLRRRAVAAVEAAASRVESAGQNSVASRSAAGSDVIGGAVAVCPLAMTSCRRPKSARSVSGSPEVTSRSVERPGACALVVAADAGDRNLYASVADHGLGGLDTYLTGSPPPGRAEPGMRIGFSRADGHGPRPEPAAGDVRADCISL